MATQYPTALDGEAQLDTSIAPTATLGNPSHSDQHENVNGAVQALEAKLGIGASAAASSTDQMVLVSDGSGTSWGYRGVAVFANAAARDAAVTSPEEGMTAYLQDANSVTVYSGSAWVTIADLDVLVVDSANGRVGINTTPTEVLHVATASGSSYLKQENGTATTYLGPDSANTGLFGTSTAHPVRFITNNTERVRVLSDGNMGIGTSTPSSRLEISDTNPSTLTLKSTNSVLAVGNEVQAIDFYQSDSSGGVGVSARIVGVAADISGAEDLAFHTGSAGTVAERMRINASGKVGIGTSSPLGALDIHGNTESLIFSSPSDTNRYRIDANITDAADFGLSIGYWDGIASNYKRTITFDDSGKVGIGTTSPGAPLHLFGAGNAVDQIRISSTNGTLSEYGLLAADASTNVMRYGYWDGTGYGAHHFEGKVGVGTAAPAYTMEINGDLNVGGTLYKNGGAFRIVHPLPNMAPNHDLVHSFVEAPEALLVYRGRAQLTAGAATVNLDETSTMTEGTFVALNRNVQVFTTNEESWCPTRASVVGNILTIEAQDDTCTDTISWLVCGQRQDDAIIDSDMTDETGQVIVEPVVDRTVEPQEEPEPEGNTQ